jgi:hypothetical protein
MKAHEKSSMFPWSPRLHEELRLAAKRIYLGMNREAKNYVWWRGQA